LVQHPGARSSQQSPVGAGASAPRLDSEPQAADALRRELLLGERARPAAAAEQRLLDLRLDREVAAVGVAQEDKADHRWERRLGAKLALTQSVFAADRIGHSLAWMCSSWSTGAASGSGAANVRTHIVGPVT